MALSPYIENHFDGVLDTTAEQDRLTEIQTTRAKLLREYRTRKQRLQRYLKRNKEISVKRDPRFDVVQTWTNDADDPNR